MIITTMLIILGIAFLALGISYLHTGKCYGSFSSIGPALGFLGAMFLLCGVSLIVSGFGYYKYDNNRKNIESEVIKDYKDGYKLYINGEKKNKIDINGLNLKNYDIVIDKHKIYLKEKR